MDICVRKRRTFSGGRISRPDIPTNPAITGGSRTKMADGEVSIITAITPTGDRPLPFRLCQKWMMNQTRKPDQWIVVDDGKTPMAPFAPMEYVRREPQPNDPAHTLCTNMATAIPLIKGNKIIIIEDDEYYAPEYIEEMSSRLESYEVVGIGDSKYYYLPTGRWKTFGNRGHASLAQTGFRACLLPKLSDFLVSGNVIDWLDMKIWSWVDDAKRTARPISFMLFVDSVKSLYAGIKGLPGRMGMGEGHNPVVVQRYHADSQDRAKLKQWVPKDYQTYLDVLAEMK